MGLPKISQPLFELTIPSTGKKVKYRPFTVREEKILLMAQESKEIDQILLAIEQIINLCIEGVNVEDLATFDVEYIFVKLRAASVNNEVKFMIEDPVANEQIELKANLNEMEVYKDPNHTKYIPLDKEYTLVMRYPKLNVLSTISGLKDEDSSESKQAMFNVMIQCIDSLVETKGEAVYKFADYSEREVQEFVDSLTIETVNKIKKFFDTMPVLRYAIPYKLSNGTEKTFVMQGTETLFLS